MLIFALTVPTTLPEDQRTRVGLLIYSSSVKFTKSALVVKDQIELLKSRGMVFADEAKAAHYLTNISYYRLSAYWYTFLENPKSNHQFKSGTAFEAAKDTYVFDRRLRLLIFDEIERIEIALRTQIIYHYCHAYGNNWWEDESLYRRPVYFREFHERLMEEIKRSREAFIHHYRRKYTDPVNPPAWMALELASFGQLSTLYKNLKINDAHKAVAAHFRLDEIVLESWLEMLSFVRNTCAHHARLWNRKLPKPPTIPTNAAGDWLKQLPDVEYRNRIYLTLSVIAYLLKPIVPNSQFKERVKGLLNEYPSIPLAYMGFTAEWENETLWK